MTFVCTDAQLRKKIIQKHNWFHSYHPVFVKGAIGLTQNRPCGGDTKTSIEWGGYQKGTGVAKKGRMGNFWKGKLFYAISRNLIHKRKYLKYLQILKKILLDRIY